MNKRLIINADDLGINPQRSHGIFECMEFGVVSSASIIPCCSDSDDAAKKARERGLSAGLHLNLTEEYPLSPQNQIETLCEANGKFFDERRFCEQIDEGKIDPVHIERELRAQFEWIFDAYGMPTHVDSHQHIHILPTVANALLPLLDRYGIRFVRIPSEFPLPPFGYVIEDKQLNDVKKLSDDALVAKETYISDGIGTTDYFRGETLMGNASLKNMRHILAKLPEGTTELMVHPSGAIAYGTPYDLDPQRQTELRMLLDESIKTMLMERKIELCSWADL